MALRQSAMCVNMYKCMEELHMIFVYVYMNCTGDDAAIHTHKPDRGTTRNVCVCMYKCRNEAQMIFVYVCMNRTGDDAVIHTYNQKVDMNIICVYV